MDASSPWSAARTFNVKTIISHSRPDLDAVVSAWLAQDFMFPGEETEVLFVNRSRIPHLKDTADCLVDVGQEYDPARLRFDHRPPAFKNRAVTCAAKLVLGILAATRIGS
jgi:uncharacterized UPF0160 family protein